jgi:hypothetical protein
LTKLIDFHADELGLHEWLIWDETRLGELFDAYPDSLVVAYPLTTLDEALAALHSRDSSSR